MTRPRPSLVLVAAAVAVAGATALSGNLARTGHGGAAGPVSASRLATDAVLVCPDVTVDATTTSTVSAGSPNTSGTLSVSGVRPKLSAAPLAQAAPGQSTLQYTPRRPRTGPLLVHATGDRARSLTAVVVTRTTGQRRRAVQSVPCTRPTGDTWLVGGATVSGRRDVLYLTNVDPTPALVDVSVYAAGGVQEPASSQGLNVPARSQTVLALDALAPGLAATAVDVHVRSGRVAAALLDTAAIGRVPAGADWVPPAAGPARHLVVTGIPTQADGRHLLVLVAPGGSDAQVTVRLVTPLGTLSPGALNAITVPAGRLLPVDLGKIGAFPPPYALVIDSDQPVAAGVWTQRGNRGQDTDFSWAGSADPLTGGAAVLPWATQSPTAATTVELTDPGQRDQLVHVSSLDAAGTVLATARVLVGAGRNVSVAVAVPGHQVSSVLVLTAPGSTLVVGWAVLDRNVLGPLITAGSLPQTPVTVQVSAVVSDPAVGYPGH